MIRSTGVRPLPSYIDPNHGLRGEHSVMTKEESVKQVYNIEDKLGEGAFGVVNRVKHRHTGRIFALKSINSASVSDHDLFLRELSIARQFNHPHVVKLHEFFQGNSIFHLVMELCTGGDLVDKLNAEIAKNVGVESNRYCN